MRLDEEDIQRIAERVVELLDARQCNPEQRYVDAAWLARRLGVERD
jgi:hypothetical protein